MRVKSEGSLGLFASQTGMILLVVLWMFPFVWMLSTALKPNAEVFQFPPKLFGSRVEWSNFPAAWNFVPFGRFMFNGLLVSGIGTLLVIFTSILSAYAFARLHFWRREQLFLIYLGTLMIPQEVTVVPLFLMMKSIGWINTYQALILPSAFTAFGTFLLRQFFLTIPRDFEEAARIDGATRWQILWRVIVPMAKPAIAVLALFTFIGYWNNFLWPLIAGNTREMATVPVGLNLFNGQHGTEWNYMMAASTISILPTLILTVLLQKYIIEGVSISGFGGR
ncbi:MAG: carbohydrate ABC transporter permease [Verrucomicrobia bacterium]|nr:carbohydrate ABC transporter permease [Verrucomicrobiota bacterium]MBV9673408.1 carbohydrate ABC transporter permease [Verrucomicrobiota bacterium]